MRKGVTPVVATVLLITITFAAAGTLYTMVQSNINEAEDSNPDLPLNINSLNVEQCYNEGGNTHLVIRNGAQQSINSSKMNVLLNGSLEDEADYSTEPEIVNPQRTFEVELQTISSETPIKMTNGRNTLEYTCYDLP
jgi:flagellin-like protein